ncbi:ABC transporter substrate-binding protein [Microtetraspora sp. AC03309]|uniref:ABC transporter substrate-binding protein n=1 Tax=Microtetraspora sp. AC03309 TaxID=2779376 RepID=UPI001E2CA9EE|nr:ABC transporter substrate-binding protein [Microtetraspora sp. AC03309]MCC5578469.1 ABC transporter substrate-binding protein [Microtetraspora sp. AC03309]
MNTLSVAFGDYPHALVEVNGYQVEPVEVRPIISAYRRMIRDLEFDVCELAPVSYLMARQAGVPLTAIPVFLNRRFHHEDVQCASRSGIRVPRDLEGRRVGVRAYSVSTGVWVRGLLAEEYGVANEKITWVVDDDDHVEGRVPTNVERVSDGRSLGELLSAEELDAALTGNAGTGRAGAPRADWTSHGGEVEGSYPLFPDADVLSADWYLRTGIYPMHSLVVIRSELVERDPGLPAALYAALAESKRRHFTADPRLARQSLLIGGDPIPYGIAANEPSLHALVRFSRDQGLLDPDFSTDVRELFAEGDYT